MAEHGKAKRGIPPKSDFNAWYPAIVEIAELVDKRYPIKGMDVWRPYGWKAMRCIDNLTHAEMERTDHEEVRFPLLIPESLLEKENRLVSLLKRAREEGVDPSELRDEEEEAGFKKEVYWVKHAGETDLDVPMFLRPTSETAMYTMFPLWIRSHADLPLKTYQIVNTFRYETKQTRSFIRVREIHFFEAHTAHVDEACASRQIEEDLEIVGRLMQSMSLPVIISKRPVWDTFPGAWYTIAIDVIMPNGRTLQVASCHHYKDQWAKAFDMTYQNDEGETQYCHQTTYGMSERLLGAVVGMHGDDNGLIFPPSIAPIQVVIMPVAAHKNPDVLTTVESVSETLRQSGFRVKVDSRDLRPGQKYWDWEIKGVPLRLEIGPRDVENGNAFAARRTGGKEPIPLDDISNSVQQQLSLIGDELSNRSHSHVIHCVNRLNSLDQEIVDGQIYEIAFDGTDADAELLEKTTGLAMLGEALTPYETEQVCIITGKPTTRKQHIARMY
ncbi:MAG: His/Gly/Thr/Pro-type tRNA ligase C-terminal domain-containing protein [Candidatus Thalassarchaeaceae archaeon]|jgi:prolyl-tRNA synthetase|nr:His/Gly/Thr/Pro-type tRNA ligase C-terminal domain-containing protein [Candidatus Thalassarchaeaceae archaeon]